jgi:hypothetical protein
VQAPIDRRDARPKERGKRASGSGKRARDGGDGAFGRTRDAWTCWRYRALWSWSNRDARRSHRRAPAPLSEAQERVLADLRHAGIARASFPELFGERIDFAALRRTALDWSDSEPVERAERLYRKSVRSRPRFKGFLASRFEKGDAIAWDDPWLRAGIDSSLLALAGHYFGLLPRLHHVNLWKSFPLDHPGPLVGPQAWHRDPADLTVLKAFLYLSDVTEDAGPLEYVPHSRTGERFGNLWPARIPLAGSRPPPLELERRIPVADRLCCCHPEGTVVLVDTAGFHRGGRAVGHARLVATWAYSSQASLWPRKFRVEGLGDRPVSTAVRFALAPPRAGASSETSRELALGNDAGEPE